jgi:hypothetical protein
MGPLLMHVHCKSDSTPVIYLLHMLQRAAKKTLLPLQFEAESAFEAQMVCNNSRESLTPLTPEHVPLAEQTSAYESQALEHRLPVRREASSGSPRASHNPTDIDSAVL